MGGQRRHVNLREVSGGLAGCGGTSKTRLEPWRDGQAKILAGSILGRGKLTPTHSGPHVIECGWKVGAESGGMNLGGHSILDPVPLPKELGPDPHLERKQLLLSPQTLDSLSCKRWNLWQRGLITFQRRGSGTFLWFSNGVRGTLKSCAHIPGSPL